MIASDYELSPRRHGRRRRVIVALVLVAALCALAWAVFAIPFIWALAGATFLAGLILFVSQMPRTISSTALSGVKFMDRIERDAAISSLVTAFPEPVIMLDGRTHIRLVNPAATRLFAAMEVGRPVGPYLRAPELATALDRVTNGGGAETVAFLEQFPIERWLEALLSPLGARGPGGRPELVMLAIRDLTPAQRLERMRADFVANASHELRTPLASLTGFIETLQGPARDDAAARDHFLEIMSQQARRMARLIDDLMSLSRIELKAHVQPDSEIDLVPVVRHVVDALQPIAADNGVAIDLSLPDSPLVMLGDRDEITQVGQNVVENAIKYGRDGKKVEVTLSPTEIGKKNFAALAVRDYGPGIPSQHLPRLTERFYRVDVTQSRESGGTGLGLAIVKHILNRHRGQLKIDSREGHGATFIVLLPLRDKELE